MSARIGVVAIGRNEGERLKACLRSAVPVGPTVYVDSGSTDGSQAFAAGLGVEVVALAVPPGFTAARARNAGAAALLAAHPDVALIQFVDGDCELRAGWPAAAAAALAAEPDVALVFGRRRERYPEASIYNALCDDEWDVAVGPVAACGGDVLIRADALAQVGGYPDAMIAGEEPDTCMRLAKAGWRMRRIDAEMTWHDAAITRFGQWWRRTRRAGHAFAELAWRHPDVRAPDWRRICRRIVVWGGIGPAAALLGLGLAIVSYPEWLLLPIAVVGLNLLNLVRVARRRRADGLSPRLALASAFFLMIGKLPELLGLLAFHRDRRAGRAARLIEYKG